MRSRGLLALLLALTGCAHAPDVAALCGTWSGDDVLEQWWIAGDDLRGEGRIVQGGAEVVHETLALRRTRAGHVYVATPGDAAPTEFRPIAPADARFGPETADADAELVQLSWANYEHDFPQEIHYLLAGDRLTAIVAGPNQQHAWTLQRSATCPPAP